MAVKVFSMHKEQPLSYSPLSLSLLSPFPPSTSTNTAGLIRPYCRLAKGLSRSVGRLVGDLKKRLPVDVYLVYLVVTVSSLV